MLLLSLRSTLLVVEGKETGRSRLRMCEAIRHTNAVVGWHSTKSAIAKKACLKIYCALQTQTCDACTFARLRISVRPCSSKREDRSPLASGTPLEFPVSPRTLATIFRDALNINLGYFLAKSIRQNLKLKILPNLHLNLLKSL